MRLLTLMTMVLTVLSLGLPAQAAPRIVVSISPLHALVSAVTRGVTEPQLLLHKNTSLHHYHFKPSDMVALSDADIVFLIHPEFETFMAKFVGDHPQGDSIKIVSLSQASGIKLTPYATLSHEDEHHHEHHHEHDHHHHDHHEHNHSHGTYDYHLWLSPMNAVAMVQEVSRQLIALDPENAKIYRRNAKLYVEKLHALDKDLSKRFAPYQSVGFLAAHDALGVLSHHYHLNYQGGIVFHPEIPSSVKALEALQYQIQEEDVRCIFTETTTPSKLAEALAAHTAVRLEMVDIEWVEHRPSDHHGDGYIRLMTDLVQNMTHCFAGQ